MTTRAANRHTLPRGRRATLAAYALLSEDTASLRTQVAQDRLDQAALGATVGSLLGDVGRLSSELSGVREELAALRVDVQRAQAQPAPTGPDPLLALLAEHSADLREQLTGTQVVVAELAGRLTEVLTGRLARIEDLDSPDSPDFSDAPGSFASDGAGQGLAGGLDQAELAERDSAQVRAGQLGWGHRRDAIPAGPGADAGEAAEGVAARVAAEVVAARVVTLAPTVTRLDAVPDADADVRDRHRPDSSRRDPVHVAAARLHAVRRALEG
ncbi:MAG: hypothetical protein ABI468_05435 [Candidatus Nanopelagicales bacterium]